MGCKGATGSRQVPHLSAASDPEIKPEDLLATKAMAIPQGSFTNHFASKEAFGLQIIDLYLANGRLEPSNQTKRFTLKLKGREASG
jgi:hypothetical protein